MSAFRQFVSRYQLALFCVLTYAISWSIVLPLDGRIWPQGPTLAAIILLAIVAGRRGLSDLWQRVTRRRVRWIWYLVAPGVVVAFHLGAFLLNLRFGATAINTSHLQSWSAVPLLLAQLLLLGGQWEEPGWSGYALPYVQKRFANRALPGLLIATLIVGAIRVVWHLPLFLYGHIPWYDFLLFSIAFQIIISWLYDRTNGSILIIMLFHLASNVVAGIMLPLFSGVDQARYGWLFTALAWVIALVIIAHSWYKSRRGARVRQGSQPVLRTERS
jgi:hypothetical protein